MDNAINNFARDDAIQERTLPIVGLLVLVSVREHSRLLASLLQLEVVYSLFSCLCLHCCESAKVSVRKYGFSHLEGEKTTIIRR